MPIMSKLSDTVLNEATGQVINGIPPALIKNFNAYEILEPKKVPTSPSSTSSENLLIDFKTPADGPRFIEKEEEGFTIIDLYQNIFVSPELVSKKSTTQTNVDYEDFLRKLESGNKIDSGKHSQKISYSPTAKQFEIINHPEIVRAKVNSLDFDFAHFDKINQQQSTVTANDNETEHKQETETYQEELIDEVLLDRSVEKNKLANRKNKEDFKDVRVLSPPIISNNRNSRRTFSSQQNSSKTQEYLKYYPNNPRRNEGPSTNFNENYFKQPPYSRVEAFGNGHFNKSESWKKTTPTRNYNDNSSKNSRVPCPPHSHGGNGVCSNEESCNPAPTFTPDKNGHYNTLFQYLKMRARAYRKLLKENGIEDEDENTKSKPFVSDVNALIKSNVDPGKMMKMPIETVTKDNKDYAKNRIPTEEYKKRVYTKGPDVDEKRVALPQLLNKLSIQKQEREAKSNVKKRLILHPESVNDTADGNQAPMPVLEPTVLMEDCNKERLVSLKVRQKLSELVQGDI
ncbi:uncharacterized protein LOC114362455 [Ostrinia furnacalis]|uniref:uncharacterized protein LOC114362455 n=1 Tax=Ostrinia furnacalis TaxID=93504 RepID=UPI001040837E|nr:uncharacterized protein LOC114362455 [Ostrinia furnacalis]XP_028173682.1 uncharacterized protein LOC114362455 [Ostrinia furnacalis]XP_028173683.1 uncharacterized protein LOC114362455 [Ostrinia furnacalis]XP_028173684.1 uncharacterized protein LOC114362455 [Ostrinia furnacalis]